MKKSAYKILLVGNPNCGKTTIFNSLCEMNEKVGNYSGVTVEGKCSKFSEGGCEIRVEDLPGVYTLSASTAEERVARDAVCDGDYDLIVNIVDGSNFERNMFLTMQIAEMKAPMVVVINMNDELERDGKFIDADGLSAALGVPVMKSVGYSQSSTVELKKFIIKNVSACTLAHFPWGYLKGNILTEKIAEVTEILSSALPDSMRGWAQWFAVRALENDKIVMSTLEEKTPHVAKAVEKIRNDFEAATGESPENLVVAARYGLIDKLCMPFLRTIQSRTADFTRLLDALFLNKYFGIPVFLALMFCVFEFVFALGDPLMGIMEKLFALLGAAITSVWSTESVARDFVVDGVLGGVGSVLIFLPNIVLLFLGLAILEDSGYMARAAFLCDRLMKRFGLGGSSVIPMLIGFGCSVPAIIGARTLKSRTERLATIIVIPFFSCGARFPVYVLLIPAFFAQEYCALAMFALYATGIVAAMLFSRLLRSTVLRGESSTFLIEFPPYRMPRTKNIFEQVKLRTEGFVKNAGTIIFAMSVLLWGLSNFPQNPKLAAERDVQIASVQNAENLSTQAKSAKIAALQNDYTKEKFNGTIMGELGKALEPVFRPLGFDNKIVGAVLASLAGKEVFITQIGIIYGIANSGKDSPSLREKIAADYTPRQGASILLFILLMTPCMATLATTYSETKSIGAVAAQFFGNATAAYVAAFVLYQTASFL